MRTIETIQSLQQVARGDARADTAFCGGKLFLVHTREWFDADLLVHDGKVAAFVERTGSEDTRITQAHKRVDVSGKWLVPGFIDAHVHIESAKLTPAGFAESVVPRGTTCVVAEPHEIGNVLGVEGTRWFMDSAADLPITSWFMVPSCVPASQFESAGHTIDQAGIEELLEHPRALGVGELMNFPAIVSGESSELAKAQANGSSHADGHAPGLGGAQLDAYVAAGINSDHESVERREAIEKRRRGMWVLLREASNAHNLRDLLPMVRELGPEFCAFCTDDREPDDLAREGHIDHMLRLAVSTGVEANDALLMATLHPAMAHGIDKKGHGALVPGSRADLVVLDDLEEFKANSVYVAGTLVAANGKLVAQAQDQIEHANSKIPEFVTNSVKIGKITPEHLRVPAMVADTSATRVIGARDGQLLTDTRFHELPRNTEGDILADTSQDVLHIAVIERHNGTGRIGLGFVHGFGLTEGAFASTVAHDAHNLVIVGADHASMAVCANRLAEIGGGIVTAKAGAITGELALPIAGLVSNDSPANVVAKLDALHELLRADGVKPKSPFMMLSFLALSVIPSLKITDHGYIDVDEFALVGLSKS